MSIDTEWVKAIASGGDGGNCVQMRRHDGVIEVRDSKAPTGPTLGFSKSEFGAWLAGAKNGEFDDLLGD
jgi:hypothetical protein